MAILAQAFMLSFLFSIIFEKYFIAALLR